MCMRMLNDEVRPRFLKARCQYEILGQSYKPTTTHLM